MTQINGYQGTTPIVYLEGSGELAPDPTGANRLRANMIAGGTLIAQLSARIAAVANMIGSADIYAFGRIGTDPNKFGSANMVGAGTLFANGQQIQNGLAIMAGAGDLTALGRTIAPDAAEYIIHVQIVPDASPGRGDVYSARIMIGAVMIPIRSYSFNASRDVAGIDVNVTLSRLADAALLSSAGDAFKFDLFSKGEWTTIFDAGKLTKKSVSVGIASGRATDAASFSTAAPVADQLAITPENDLTIYDPERLTINPGEFSSIFDTEGNEYIHELKALPGMTLYSLLNYIFVQVCGFDAVETTIPDFRIQRFDVGQSQSFYEAIGGHIGFTRPLPFVIDGKLWILDTTTEIPDGFAAPRVLKIGDYKTAEFSFDNVEIDGYKIKYAEIGDDYDYIVTRTPDPDTSETGNILDPGYTKTIVTTTFRDYFKNTNPTTPVRSEKVQTITETQATFGQTISVETENFFYDNLNRPTKVENRTKKRIPDLTDPDFGAIFTNAGAIDSKFEYKADITDPRRAILWRTTHEKTGLIVIDAGNQSLGKDFKQEFTNSYRSGNLSESLTVDFAAIETTIETITQRPNGQQSVVTKTIDHLPFFPQTTTAVRAERAGDATINARTSQAKELIVLRPGASRTTRRLDDLSVDQFPIRFAVPLARRRIDQINRKRGSLLLKGIDLTIRRGSVLEIWDRDDVSFGVFIVEGFSVAAQNLGLANQATAQNLDLIEIKRGAAGGDPPPSPPAIQIEPGASKVFTLAITGAAGYEITASSPAGVVVSARLDPGDAWTNISAGSLSTNSFAGSTQNVYFRIAVAGGVDPADVLARIRVALA